MVSNGHCVGLRRREAKSVTIPGAAAKFAETTRFVAPSLRPYNGRLSTWIRTLIDRSVLPSRHYNRHFSSLTK